MFGCMFDQDADTLQTPDVECRIVKVGKGQPAVCRSGLLRRCGGAKAGQRSGEREFLRAELCLSETLENSGSRAINLLEKQLARELLP